MAHMSGLAAEPATRGPGRPSITDDELVALAKRDRAAFGPLYDRYADLVYRYCLRRLGNRETAEDATGQSFVKVLAALPTYRNDGPSFRSWLFAIAHKRAGRCRARPAPRRGP
jgi:RNA polymerase sigma-70 factor (ECF subfamily)